MHYCDSAKHWKLVMVINSITTLVGGIESSELAEAARFCYKEVISKFTEKRTIDNI